MSPSEQRPLLDSQKRERWSVMIQTFQGCKGYQYTNFCVPYSPKGTKKSPVCIGWNSRAAGLSVVKCYPVIIIIINVHGSPIGELGCMLSPSRQFCPFLLLLLLSMTLILYPSSLFPPLFSMSLVADPTSFSRLEPR